MDSNVIGHECPYCGLEVSTLSIQSIEVNDHWFQYTDGEIYYSFILNLSCPYCGEQLDSDAADVFLDTGTDYPGIVELISIQADRSVFDKQNIFTLLCTVMFTPQNPEHKPVVVMGSPEFLVD